MRKMLTTILKSMLAVAIMTMISFTWGNQLVSPNVNFGEIFCGKPVVAKAEENTYSLHWTKNEDATFTVTLYVDEELGGFDYGIAFSPKEVTVVEYGFTQQFKDHYSNQQGSVIDHYFSEGERVSEAAQYIVYGGMATKTATYEGEVCYVTVSLKGEQASFYAVKDSAKYEHARELMDGGVSCTLVKEETTPEKPSQNSAVSNVSKNNDTEKSKEETTKSQMSKETNNEASTSDTKSLHTVKTGDKPPVVQYLFAITLASFVLIITGRTFFQKN